jgi:uncharacterized phage protein gp47/JayE
VSLQTPTTQEINDNIVAQLQASLNQTIPLLPKSFLRVLAKVMAGVFVLLYKYGGFIFLQIFVRTASANQTEVNGVMLAPLIEWGRLIGVGDPGPATQSELLIDITVETQSGQLPSGSQLIGQSNGVTYITIGSILLDSSTVQVTIRAVSDQSGGDGSGVVGNLNPGDVVSFANPLPNVSRNAAVVSQVTTGADQESVEVYRQRIIDRFRKRPQGGAYADYQIWGEEPSGIINVYPYTSDCPGQVDVYVEATPESSGNADGIPSAAQLQEVLQSIELDANGMATRRQANALPNVFPITRTGFDVLVLGLVVDNLPDVRADIEAALEEYFLDREPFIVGLSVPPRKDRITKSAAAGVVEDIVSAAGGIFTDANITQNGSPISTYTLGIGEKAKSESVTFI